MHGRAGSTVREGSGSTVQDGGKTDEIVVPDGKSIPATPAQSLTVVLYKGCGCDSEVPFEIMDMASSNATSTAAATLSQMSLAVLNTGRPRRRT